MNTQDRAELDSLNRRLEALQREVALLRMRASQLESRLASPTVPDGVPAPAPAPARPVPPPIPGPLSATPAPILLPTARPEPPTKPAPGPLPEPVPESARPPSPRTAAEDQLKSPAWDRPRPAPLGPVRIEPEAARQPTVEAVDAVVASGGAGSAAGRGGEDAASGRPEGSFEMRLGTYWLARIGIVMLLTAMVFFGKYAYQKFVVQMGPGGKVLLLYLASGALLGLGTWLQRRREEMRNYAQVLFGGGLAAVYFTTYAAHHVANLRVIESPVLDGLALLGWAGFMTWLADRKKSELLGLFSIGLAYYTAAITQVGWFTLYSNLVLTAAAVGFLLRNRWAGLSFLSLLATYAGYVFWRFGQGGEWHWASPEAGLGSGVAFMLGYWVLFTAGVLLSRAESFAGPQRVLFLSLNNAAFFVLFLLTMLQVKSGGFWRFSLLYGAGLLGTAILARRCLPAEPLARNAYLTQGLVLVTVGLIARFSDLQLALVLAAESVVLLPLGQRLENRVLKTGAFTSAALATLAGLGAMVEHDTGILWLGAGVGALLLANALWLARHEVASSPAALRPGTSYFALLALVMWLATTWQTSSAANLPLVLTLEAVALTASVYAFRVREVVLLGQLFAAIGLGTWLITGQGRMGAEPFWRPAGLVALALGLIHWWHREGRRHFEVSASRVWQALYAVAVVGVLHFWVSAAVGREAWLGWSAVLALALTLYGAATGAWLVAAAGQLFVAVSVWECVRQFVDGSPSAWLALAPIAALAALAIAGVQWFRFRPDTREGYGEPISSLSRVYRWVALFLVLAWVHEYVGVRERFWVLATMGAGVFAWAGWRRNLEGCLVSAVLSAAGVAGFWLEGYSGRAGYLPDLAAIGGLLAQQQAARRWGDRFAFQPGWHVGLMCVGDASLWLFVTRWVLASSGGFYLTVGWAMLALGLFLAGMGLRERMHRWLGLAVLAAALGRVIVFDVWKLETLYRIISFFGLGVVLLVLGFIYNRFQEKIRQWL